MTDFFLFAWTNLNGILISISKIIFRFRFSFPALLPFKNVKFYFRSCQKPRKRRPGHSLAATSYQERSRCQNKLHGSHCGDLIHFISLYSATAKLSTKLCETADVKSNLGSDLGLLESIEWELPASEVESETELQIEKEAIQNQKTLPCEMDSQLSGNSWEFLGTPKNSPKFPTMQISCD